MHKVTSLGEGYPSPRIKYQCTVLVGYFITTTVVVGHLDIIYLVSRSFTYIKPQSVEENFGIKKKDLLVGVDPKIQNIRKFSNIL